MVSVTSELGTRVFVTTLYFNYGQLAFSWFRWPVGSRPARCVPSSLSYLRLNMTGLNQQNNDRQMFGFLMTIMNISLPVHVTVFHHVEEVERVFTNNKICLTAHTG